MGDAFDFEKVVGHVRSLVRLRKELGTSTKIFWKYLLFEWNDSDRELARAVELAREIGVDKLQFTLPGYPSPSKRFKGSPNTNIKVLDFSGPPLKDADLEFWNHQ